MPVNEKLKQYAMTLGFPQSENLARVFEIIYDTEDDVTLVAALPGTVEEIAGRAGMPEEKVRAIVDKLLSRGAISHPMKRPELLRRFPAMIELRDATVLWPEAPQELFEKWDDLIQNETKALVPVLKNLKIPPMVRVVPIERTVQTQNRVLDVDAARKIFEEADLITVLPCACRTVARRNGRGEDCPAPADAVCMQTNAFAQAVIDRGIGERITREEALRRLALAEEAGLVHMIRNNVKKDMFMCNCCSCCCTGLHFVNKLGYAAGIAPSRFRVELDDDLCTACGTCEDRCQFHAITVSDKAVIDLERCYGCGSCAVSCPEGALGLIEVRPVEHIRVT